MGGARDEMGQFGHFQRAACPRGSVLLDRRLGAPRGAGVRVGRQSVLWTREAARCAAAGMLRDPYGSPFRVVCEPVVESRHVAKECEGDVKNLCGGRSARRRRLIASSRGSARSASDARTRWRRSPFPSRSSGECRGAVRRGAAAPV
jgi:hypothetical protein